MNLLTYIWYALRLTLQFGGPAGCGASMQLEGYGDSDIEEMEQFVARGIVKRKLKLLQNPPPWHARDASEIRELLSPYEVPPLEVLDRLPQVFVRAGASRWMNWALAHVSAYVWNYDLLVEKS